MTKKQKKQLIRILIALILYVVVIVVDHIVDFKSLGGVILPLCLYGAIYLFISYDVIIKSLRNIFHGEIFDEFFLMSIATLGAFAIGQYPEGLAVMIFYQVGEWFQNYAVAKSRKSISELMDIRPDFANKLNDDGSYVKVDPSDVLIGDKIIVKPGEKIPLDGVVVKGNSLIDSKALTGESLPQDIECGMSVMNGTINLTQTLVIEVKKVFGDSTVSKILNLVENASSAKSKSENFITTFSKYYTPIVVICAFLLAIIPSIITNDWSVWIYRSLSFLVVSCPCALVISIPLSFFAGIGAASKKGILIKGANYVEKMSLANQFVFDKTGTLTKGNFVVTLVEPIEKREEILRFACTAEQGLNHPIAQSIRNSYSGKINPATRVEDVPGKGVVAYSCDTILCGNEKLMEQYHIPFEKYQEVGTVVYVAVNNEFLGVILINDEIKESAIETIAYLTQKGIQTTMLTGDNEQIAKDVSRKLGISDYKASLLPNDKVEILSNILKNKGKKDVVCFVGDGINDAPVLMQADIGIAMGGLGSDAAIEASDIVLMKDDLSKIAVAKRICNKTMTIVYENIYFAIGVKLIILLLSSIGYGNLWLAVFADVGVSVIAILNAMRALKIK